MIRLDFVMNLFFMATAFFFMHCDDTEHHNYIITVPLYGFILCFMLYTTFTGINAIRTKNQNVQFRIAILRVVIEMFKIVICILILNSFNSRFEQSEIIRNRLGKIRFSILV